MVVQMASQKVVPMDNLSESWTALQKDCTMALYLVPQKVLPMDTCLGLLKAVH